MAKFLMSVNVIGHEPDDVARLGSGSGAGNQYSDAEVGKFVKLAGESRYVLCAAGDPIEGHITAIEKATVDGFTIGSVRKKYRKYVTFDGAEATPGTGTVAVGDYVVCGTVVAKGTALSAPPKVCKATNQPGAEVEVAADANDDSTEATAALAKVASQMKNAMFAWRVVSLGDAGTGAVGTVGVIERVNH